jgi:succinate-semialdehyde dehydrogenase/glutarate-semialdehyde dehydrogenase
MAIAIVNPTTGKTEMLIEPHSGEEVSKRIAESDQAAQILRRTSFAQRSEWMRASALILESEGESFGELITIFAGGCI